MKTVLLLVLLTGVMTAQTTLPPVLLPNLPATLSQKVLISGSLTCGTALGMACTPESGSNYYLVSQAGSGGIHYDSAGSLLVAIPTSANSAELSSLVKMAPDGTPSSFINFPVTTTSGCMVTSSSSLISSGVEYMQSPF